MAPPQYGSISRNEEETTTLLPHETPLEVSDDVSPAARRGRWTWWWWCGAAAALIVGLVLWSTRCGRGWDDPPPFQSPTLVTTQRVGDSLPSKLWGQKLGGTHALPTNSWYLNLLSHRAFHHPDESTRVYTYPYIIDTAPAAPLHGVRIHWPVMQANDRNMQMVYDASNGLSLGTLQNVSHYTVSGNEDLSLLGVSLEWQGDDASMKTHIVRGMPLATMRYQGGLLPTLTSANRPASHPLVDGSTQVTCGLLRDDGTFADTATTHSVQREMLLHFKDSDFTWVVFFSHPVEIACAATKQVEVSTPGAVATTAMQLNVVQSHAVDKDELVVRVALVNQCTTGKSDLPGHCTNKFANPKLYLQTLRRQAHLYPTSPQIHFDYSNDNVCNMEFDWNVTSTLDATKTKTQRLQAAAAVPTSTTTPDDDEELVMFALPHHQAMLDSTQITQHCISTFHGPTCLVKGNKWLLKENLGRPQSFHADRPPQPWAIPALAAALRHDLQYQLSSNVLRGAADTYFSGKILARMGRVIVLASELNHLAAGSSAHIYSNVTADDYDLASRAAAKETLASNKEIQAAVEMLKRGVSIWTSDDAEAPFVYDTSWGGLVNCGCTYVGKSDQGVCNNTFPECPALSDVNVDFGNGYYNDHHFHYGYHIYAAAVVAKYDPDWGRQYFDRVLLYIRDVANAWPDDSFFTPFRHKDWFLGSSWASGIVSAENSPHGRNQESSSEAIAAYEAIALYGQVMMDAFKDSPKQLQVAKQVRNVGQLLTVTEVRAANRYWHVWNGPNHTNTYPAAYKQPAVGMLYETMASFQTWFSPQAFVSYGIQLLPLTPVAEIRDDPYWASILYPLYKKSCESQETFCVHNGWSIMELGLLATAGKPEEALQQVLEIPSQVFATQGADGNSLSNTIWFVSTRKPAT